MINISKEILFDNFSGRITPIEKANITEWLSQPENQKFYYQCLNEWENQNLQFLPDEGVALKKILDNGLSKNISDAQITKKRNPFHFFKVYTVAASAILVLSISFFLLKDQIFFKTIHTDYGQTRSVTLPDGSLVTMNANSSIKYSRFGFGSDSRKVFLSGEANFSVVHTKNSQKFIVKTDKNIDITVLGTQFNVYARESRTKVVLQRGKIELSYLSDKVNKKAILQPGDFFVEEKNGTQQLQHTQQPEKLAVWENHDFSFDGNSMKEIGQMVKDNYNIDVKFENNDLAEKKISGFFHADTIDELLNAIADLLNVNFSTKDNTVYFFQ